MCLKYYLNFNVVTAGAESLILEAKTEEARQAVSTMPSSVT